MWRSVGAAFFIFAFCTGTSFITLPFTVSHAGFWPSVVALFVSWLFLIFTAFYYLEAVLTMPPGANIASISRRYSSRSIVILNTIIFLAACYGYLLTTFCFGIPMLISLLEFYQIPAPQFLAYLFFALALFVTVAISVRCAVIVNFFLLILLGFVFYFSFRSGLVAYKPETLNHFTAAYLFVVIPSLLNSLFFQVMIPTLANFLNYSVNRLRMVILSGVTLATLLFIAWLWLVITSTGTKSFGNINWLAPKTVNFLKLYHVEGIGHWLPSLLILILTTSSIGAGTIMVDFFSDLFRIPSEERKGVKRVLLALLIFLPPLLASYLPTPLLLKVMIYITDVGGLYLCGILPIWWIWTIRYYHQVKTKNLVPGGKVTLTILTILAFFFLYLVGLEFLYQALI